MAGLITRTVILPHPFRELLIATHVAEVTEEWPYKSSDQTRYRGQLTAQSAICLIGVLAALMSDYGAVARGWEP
jgi:hypothetical protein